MMLAEVYEAAGVVPHIEVPSFQGLEPSPRRGTAPRRRHAARDRNLEAATHPGDVVVFASAAATPMGRSWSNGPRIIHARAAVGVIYGDAMQPKLASRKPRFHDPFVNIFVEPK
jgi:hypothetical protein